MCRFENYTMKCKPLCLSGIIGFYLLKMQIVSCHFKISIDNKLHHMKGVNHFQTQLKICKIANNRGEIILRETIAANLISLQHLYA